MGTNKDAVALCDNSFQMLLVHRWSFPFHLFSNLFLQSLQHKSVRSDLSTSSKPIGYPENCARGASRWWEEVCNVGTQCWCMRHSHASDVCKSQVPPTGTGKQFRLLWFMYCDSWAIHESPLFRQVDGMPDILFVSARPIPNALVSERKIPSFVKPLKAETKWKRNRNDMKLK